MTYRKAILRAIDELQDVHLRSPVNEIRKHVESNLPFGQELNAVAFLMDLKALIEEGDMEPAAASVLRACGLSPEYKQRRLIQQKRARRLRQQEQQRGGFSTMTTRNKTNASSWLEQQREEQQQQQGNYGILQQQEQHQQMMRMPAIYSPTPSPVHKYASVA